MQTFSTIAHNASEAAYPHLWRGLVGAWVPSLGVTGGTLRDASGRGYHGTLTNMDAATDWQTSGGGSLDFDGTNDYAPCGKRINASLANHLTLAMWARFDKISGTQGLLSTVSSSGNQGQQLEIGRQTGKFSWLQNAVTLDAVATNAIATGEHFVALTRTGTTDNWTITFFVDDQPADAHATSANQRSDGGIGNFTISRAGDLNRQYFDGALQGAAAWQRALTAAEIKALYQAGPGDWLKRNRRRVYSIPSPAFQAAWATRATTIAGVFR
jgi:hypothetical protein